jgi:hypothetical protein
MTSLTDRKDNGHATADPRLAAVDAILKLVQLRLAATKRGDRVEDPKGIQERMEGLGQFLGVGRAILDDYMRGKPFAPGGLEDLFRTQDTVAEMTQRLEEGLRRGVIAPLLEPVAGGTHGRT